ncbi:MAG TPA: hypothetical protein QF753_18780 [Victivallales bacterium]|nr:hypothetical protein [Victivallales bacterium]
MKSFKFAPFVLCILTSIFIISGCATSKVEKKEIVKPKIPPTPNVQNCKNYIDAGKMMLPSLLKGLETNNYAIFSRDFTPEAKKFFDEEKFIQADKALNEKLGKFKDKEYFGEYTKGKFHILLWKAHYKKTKDDIILQMYIRKINGTYKIAAFLPK